MHRAHLAGGLLFGVRLAHGDLMGSSLADTDLREADLADADLSGANLSNADLSRDHRGAQFNQADLSGVRFFAADLAGVVCRGSPRRGRPARCRSDARLNLDGVDLSGDSCRTARGASLKPGVRASSCKRCAPRTINFASHPPASPG